MKKNIYILLAILIIVGAILRFYNLNWGAPYYFHPDERNIASSVSQIEFPNQMNPHFFAYGSLPIYTIYLTGLAYKILIHVFTQNTQPITTLISFETAIIISRLYSALFSTLLIPILFLITQKISTPFIKGGKGDLNNYAGLIAAFLTTFSTGLIQFAHFGTFEFWLTFFTVILFWITLEFLKAPKALHMLWIAIVTGILIATKVSHLVLLPIPILIFLIHNTRKTKHNLEITHHDNQNLRHPGLQNTLSFLKQTSLFLLISAAIYFLANPFVILDEKSFIGSMKYESEVALGTLPVFYTGEFINTIPVLFQFLHIYPFLLNPLLTILFIPAFFYLTYLSIKTKTPAYIILNTFYLILFISQAFLYVKWARYMVPTLPFMYFIISIAGTEIIVRHKKSFSINTPPLLKGVGGILACVTILFAASYFITAFVRPDTRIAAKNYARLYIPANSPIISEVFDLGIIPFNDSFSNIKLFNFYELEANSPEFNQTTLEQELENADYIILPSQRVLKPRLQNPQSYPNGHKFYSDLFSSANGFQKIYETPCDLFCRITYLNSPVFNVEQTANVFDRPTIFIFMKNKN